MTKQIPTPTLMGGTISAGPKMPGMSAREEPADDNLHVVR